MAFAAVARARVPARPPSGRLTTQALKQDGKIAFTGKRKEMIGSSGYTYPMGVAVALSSTGMKQEGIELALLKAGL